MPANSQNSAVATGLEKVSFIPIPKKADAKECSIYHKIALISHVTEVMLQILRASTWTENFQMYKLVLGKAEEQKVKLPTSIGSWRKQSNSRGKKKSISASLTTLNF